MKKLMTMCLIALCPACGTGATIYTHDGGVYEGTIRGRDDYNNIRIGRDSIPADRVEDIDHPGNVAGILGTIVASIGVVNAIGSCSQEAREINPNGCSAAGVWFLTGLPIAIYGWVTHSNSVDKAGQ